MPGVGPATRQPGGNPVGMEWDETSHAWVSRGLFVLQATRPGSASWSDHRSTKWWSGSIDPKREAQSEERDRVTSRQRPDIPGRPPDRSSGYPVPDKELPAASLR